MPSARRYVVLVEVLLKTSEDGFFCLIGRLKIFAAFHAVESSLLIFVQCLGDVDAYVDNDVALAVAISRHGGQTFAAQTETCAGLCTGLDVDARFSIERGNFHTVAEHGLRYGEQQVVDEVVFVANEFGMFFFLDEHLYVARYAVVSACVAFSLHRNDHAFRYAGRNVDFHNFLTAYHAFATAFATFVLDDSAFAVAGGAHLLRLHHAEHASSGSQYVSRTLASATSFRRRASGTSAAVASIAGYVLANFELLGYACGNLAQRKLHLEAQIATLETARPAASATSAETSAKSAHATEDVAKLTEDIIKVHAGTAKSAGATHAIDALFSELVVTGTFVGVAQNVVGFSGLLKLLFGFLVVRIAVGVVFNGHLLIGAFYFVGTRRFLNAEYLVIVHICHICECFWGYAVCIFLLSHYHFGVANHLVVEQVSCLHAVDDAALLCVFGGRNQGHGFVKISIEGRSFGFHALESLST